MIRAIASFAIAAIAAFPVHALDIEQVETPGGINAWLVQEPSIPFVALELLFRGGTSLDTVEKSGAVNLMTGLLEEGAADMTAEDFATAREELAASFRFETGEDFVSVSAEFLSENKSDAVDLLRSALIEPTFDESAVERVRAQVLSGLRSDAEDPNAIASKAFSEQIFGNHPYAKTQSGTIETVTSLTRDDLVAAHRQALTKDRVYVSAVGDISPDELSDLLETLLGDLPQSDTALPGRADPDFSGQIDVLPYNSPQSVIQFGQPGLSRDDPDFFAAYVLNHVIGGGGFGSRLMEEIREKRGLTYGVSSYLVQKEEADLYLGALSTANTSAGDVVTLIRDTWQDVAENGITQDELDKAKTYLTGEFPLRFDGNGRIASILVGMQADDLPIDYADTRNAKVEAVTLEDVNRVARQLLDPGALTFVVVGQPEGLSSDD
ncbi:M16 family metallopeptidase [Qingshengfaniella alkalisoli]|uniref:Insulinase family protein n=1 Tax=Qingshengfaniella alkalisoli TaxID=2599296 RepID=A0A5B8I895_9RHOB|nr:pitrilysin family protein [Qingshengfaniella alkalisoli]QDY69939.1 insulinase family protein [Qingshengfaniella alkalisoli]